MKSISEPFIKRPVTTSLLMIAISLAGLLSYRLLPVSALPSVDFPTIQVVSRYPGADAQVMASLVTAPLERQLGQISGVASMRSASAMGITVITLQFVLGKDMDQSAQDVQTAISVASSVLPKDLPHPPIYHKVNPADMPVLTLAITSDNLPLVRVNDCVDSILAQRLSEVSGVGLVTIQGNQKPAVRVQLNPSTLAAKGISLEEVRKMIIRANANSPKGSLEGVRQSLTIGANDQIRNASELAKVLLSHQGGVPVCLQDVATLEDGVENSLARAWIASYQQPYQQAVLLDIQRQPNANIIRTANRVKSILPQITRVLPAGMHLSVFSDRTETIRASMQDVQFTLLLTVSLVILVLVLFLRKLGTAFIPTVTLPISMLGTFVLLYFSGFSLDSLSLMALTISAGFIVDDAVVVTENVVRHMEQGESPLSAALKGTQQIGFTVISLSISLIAVFIPLLFMPGVIGRLLREFSITLSCAVAISALVSLTLTPMMCSKVLDASDMHSKEEASRIQYYFDFFSSWLLQLYRHSLSWTLKHQRMTIVVTVVTTITTVILLSMIPKGFLPLQDTGLLLGVTDASQDISFGRMMELQKRISQQLSQDPGVLRVAAFVGAGTANLTQNIGRFYIVLKPRKERASAQEIMLRLSRTVQRVPNIRLHLQAVQDLQIDTHTSRTQFQYTLEDVHSSTLQEWVPKLLNKLKAEPSLIDIATDQQRLGLQLHVAIDRTTASRLSIPVQTIGNTLYDAFGQRQVSVIYTDLNQYRIVMENEEGFRNSPRVLEKLHISSTMDGRLVPLGSLVRANTQPAPIMISHYRQFPSATISFNLRPGFSLGGAIRSIERVQASMGMPKSIQTHFVGSVAEFRSTLKKEFFLVLSALATVYIVLGILYESYFHPITILSTLPSAGVGATLALLLCGLELSLVALVGIILLIGIVKKNAIMMIDFALDARREKHLSARDAIYQASLLRFRPIMMTTATTLLGAIPMALGSGLGSELYRPLGVVITGGLLLSQLVTLYTTPVVYLYLDRLEQCIKQWRKRVAT
ncbi:MAG: efflux RND transporter permease subunit [Candidatus Xiphinematobacter sp.]|nr:MAG: efflux RND transporter permease subunit [Candidatus Xiphinematobacter sp.]